MLASLLDQIIISETDEEYSASMLDHLKTHYKNERSRPCRSYRKLRSIFCEILKISSKPVTVVIDALNECDDPKVITEAMRGMDQHRFRFLITSRPGKYLSDFIHTMPRLAEPVSSVTMNHKKEDIRLFLQQTVATDSELSAIAAKHDTLSLITDNSDGMFRYVELMVQELRFETASTISKILRSMPRGLTEMYEKILLRLHDENPGDLGWRKHVLLCFSRAYQRMTVAQVKYSWVAQHTSGDEEFDPRDLSISLGKIQRACGPLVEEYQARAWRERYLRFTHLSVKDFIRQKSQKLQGTEIQLLPNLIEGHELLALVAVRICHMLSCVQI